MLPPTPTQFFILFELDFDKKFSLLRLYLFLSAGMELGLLLQFQINTKNFFSSNPAIPLSKQFHISREITFVYKKCFKI